MLSSLLMLSLSLGSAIATTVPANFRIDAHRHAIPDVWYDALAASGLYPVIDGVVYTDGFPLPRWNVTGHIATLDREKVDFNIFGIDAPGTLFLQNDPVAHRNFTRQLNLLLHNYTQTYPTRLGALCLTPMPDIDATIAEIEWCMNTPGFVGVGVFSNYNGIYWGDSVYEPVYEALDKYPNIPVQVHPNSPGCANASIGYANTYSELTFDTTRVIENLRLTGTRAKHPNIDFIFVQAGGTSPYQGPIIAGVMNALRGLNITETLLEFQSYYFDLSSSYSINQLTSLARWAGVSKILIGTDWPYNTEAFVTPQLASIQVNGGFTDAEMKMINHTNVLTAFTRVTKQLGFTL